MAHLPHKCESEAQEDGLLLLEGFSLRTNIGRVGDFCLGFIHIIFPYKYHHFDTFVPRSNEYDMKADVNTLTHIFWDYNKKCFGNSLPTPYIELFDKPGKIARFEYHKNGKKAKKPIKNQVIYFSKTYEFDENTMRDVMVHEMIHYYIAWNRIKDNGSHGRKFWRMAKDLNEQYGLNIRIYAGAPLPDKPIGYFQRIINVIRRW